MGIHTRFLFRLRKIYYMWKTKTKTVFSSTLEHSRCWLILFLSCVFPLPLHFYSLRVYYSTIKMFRAFGRLGSEWKMFTIFLVYEKRKKKKGSGKQTNIHCHNSNWNGLLIILQHLYMHGLTDDSWHSIQKHNINTHWMTNGTKSKWITYALCEHIGTQGWLVGWLLAVDVS